MDTKRPLNKPSLLFVPALEDRFWSKLPELAPRVGGFIFDLEDSIHHAAKKAARDKILQNLAVLKALREKNAHIQIIVRINNVNTKHYEADVDLIRELMKNSHVDGIMYPKPSGPEEIDRINNDLETQKIFLFVVIETLAGYARYKEILSSDKGVQWTAIGAEDLCADMNIERPVVFYSCPLLSRIATDVALHAKLRGIKFWGNIWPYLHLIELLPFFVEEIINDYMMGAVGKVLFHPYQIDIVNSVFNPEVRREIQKRVMVGRLSAIAERSKKDGLSVALFNGRMVDMPELIRLRRWLQELSDEDMKKSIVTSVPELRPFLEDAF